MTVRVGVVGGTRLPGNVRTFLENVRRLLTDSEFDFDLVIRSGIDPPPMYRPVDPGIADTDRALGTIRTLIRTLTTYARAEPVDVLFQVTKFPVHGAAAVIAGRRTGTPVVTRYAGDNFREFRLATGYSDRLRTYALNNLLGRLSVRLSTATVALGPCGRRTILRRGGNRVWWIPQPIDRRFGTDEEPATVRSPFEMPPSGETRILLTVGRVSRRKGMLDLEATARQLGERGTNCRWYVVGDGPLRERIASLPTVKAVGRIPHDEVARYYRAADLVVHPSLIEGLPNVLLEAAVCGVPSLARDIGDCAVAASATFEDADSLPDLVLGDYEPAALGPRFDPDWQRQAYAALLSGAARGHLGDMAPTPTS